MVISVFPDVSQGFARYEQSRRGRLQDQALRTQNNMMQRRQAAFQDMVAGLEGQERTRAEAMGLDYVPFAIQQDAAQQAAAAQAAQSAREQQVAFLEDWGGRYARERASLGDEFDESAFMRNARVAAANSGVPMSRPDDPNALPEAIRSYSTGVEMDEPRAGGSEFERISMALTDPDLDPALRSAYEARLERLTGPGGQNITLMGATDPNALRVPDSERARLGIPEDDTRAYFYDVDRQGRVTGASPVGEMQEPEEPVDLDQVRLNALQVRQYNDAQLQDLESIIDTVDRWPVGAVGLGSGIAEQFRGTPAANVVSLLDSVTGAVALERLENLRNIAAEAGQRGSGLGQVTEREIAILRAARGALSNEQDPQTFMRNARRLLTQLQEVRAERRRILARDFPEIEADIYGGDTDQAQDDAEEAINFFLNQSGD